MSADQEESDCSTPLLHGSTLTTSTTEAPSVRPSLSATFERAGLTPPRTRTADTEVTQLDTTLELTDNDSTAGNTATGQRASPWPAEARAADIAAGEGAGPRRQPDQLPVHCRPTFPALSPLRTY